MNANPVTTRLFKRLLEAKARIKELEASCDMQLDTIIKLAVIAEQRACDPQLLKRSVMDDEVNEDPPEDDAVLLPLSEHREAWGYIFKNNGVVATKGVVVSGTGTRAEASALFGGVPIYRVRLERVP